MPTVERYGANVPRDVPDWAFRSIDVPVVPGLLADPTMGRSFDQVITGDFLGWMVIYIELDRAGNELTSQFELFWRITFTLGPNDVYTFNAENFSQDETEPYFFIANTDDARTRIAQMANAMRSVQTGITMTLDDRAGVGPVSRVYSAPADAIEGVFTTSEATPIARSGNDPVMFQPEPNPLELRVATPEPRPIVELRPEAESIDVTFGISEPTPRVIAPEPSVFVAANMRHRVITAGLTADDAVANIDDRPVATRLPGDSQ